MYVCNYACACVRAFMRSFVRSFIQSFSPSARARACSVIHLAVNQLLSAVFKVTQATLTEEYDLQCLH